MAEIVNPTPPPVSTPKTGQSGKKVTYIGPKNQDSWVVNTDRYTLDHINSLSAENVEALLARVPLLATLFKVE